MDTFTTILVWLGSGFAFAFGIFVAMALVCAFGPSRKKQDEANAETIRLMQERNAIDSANEDHLRSIAIDIAAIRASFDDRDEPEDEPA